jgi:hypothetical protein
MISSFSRVFLSSDRLAFPLAGLAGLTVRFQDPLVIQDHRFRRCTYASLNLRDRTSQLTDQTDKKSYVYSVTDTQEKDGHTTAAIETAHLNGRCAPTSLFARPSSEKPLHDGTHPCMLGKLNASANSGGRLLADQIVCPLVAGQPPRATGAQLAPSTLRRVMVALDEEAATRRTISSDKTG